MSVKLELYKIFKEVCEQKSISEAAKTLFISQSAVSQSIKQLEKSVEVKLLQRTAKGVVPTAEGQLLYEYISSALDLIGTAEQKLEAMKNLMLGDLKIGASDTISRYILLPVLEKFHAQFPSIKLEIANRTTSEAIALLKSGKIDLAFINMPIEDKELVVEPYLQVSDIFVGTATNKEFKNKTYSLQETAQLPLILLEEISNSRRYVEEFFLSRGIQIHPEIELGSHDLLLEFAKINLGVSCVIKEFSMQYLLSGDLVQLKTTTPIPKRNIGIARHKGVSLSATAKEFIKLAR